MVLAVVLPVLAAMAWWLAGAHVGLRVARDVPDDVRRLAIDVWADTAAALPARAACLDGALLVTDRDLGDRARYLPASSTIVLRIPATAAQLESALIHELAHHIERTCADHLALRPAFLAAQGHPADADWFTGDRWDDVPSEQYAEAMVLHVRGRRGFHRQMHIDGAALAAVRAWAEGH